MAPHRLQVTMSPAGLHRRPYSLEALIPRISVSSSTPRRDVHEGLVFMYYGSGMLMRSLYLLVIVHGGFWVSWTLRFVYQMYICMWLSILYMYIIYRQLRQCLNLCTIGNNAKGRSRGRPGWTQMSRSSIRKTSCELSRHMSHLSMPPPSDDPSLSLLLRKEVYSVLQLKPD